MLIEIQRCRLTNPIALDCGRALDQVEIAYETYGELNANASNAILVCHGLTSDQHAAGRYQPNDTKLGWWDAAIGPGKAIDTTRWCVISSNVIGGQLSTGPNTLDPSTGRPYGTTFPVITVTDMVAAQAQLLDRLGITVLHAAIGGCLGGFQVLTWLSLFSARVKRAIVISATAQVAAYTIALWKVMREALAIDPDWHNGDFPGQARPERGLRLMSRIGALVWMDPNLLETRCSNRLIDPKGPLRYGFEPIFEVEALFEKIGRGGGAAALDPLSLTYLMRAMDYFDLGRGHSNLAQAFPGPATSTLLVSYGADWRYSPAKMDEIRVALETRGWPVHHRTLESDFGHGSFIYDTAGVGEVMRSFLTEDDT